VDLCNFESSQQAMSAYGYEIVQTLITDIEPDVHVKRAMNEINAGIFFEDFEMSPQHCYYVN
jgi:hypothetical protein